MGSKALLRLKHQPIPESTDLHKDKNASSNSKEEQTEESTKQQTGSADAVTLKDSGNRAKQRGGVTQPYKETESDEYAYPTSIEDSGASSSVPDGAAMSAADKKKRNVVDETTLTKNRNETKVANNKASSEDVIQQNPIEAPDTLDSLLNFLKTSGSPVQGLLDLRSLLLEQKEEKVMLRTLVDQMKVDITGLR